MKRKILMVLFILAAVALIGFSAWQIISILRERYISREEYDRARESYVSAIQPKEDAEEEPTETDPFPDLDVVEHDSEMYSIPLTDDAYQQYLSAVLELGSMDGYVPFTEEEETAMEESSPIVTLSTCYGSAGTSKRLLIQGIEIERRTVA